MGNHVVYNGLLLDECDFGLDKTATADDVVETVTEHLDQRFAPDFDDTTPIVDVKALVLERHDLSIDLRCGSKYIPWFEPDLGFAETMIKQCVSEGLPQDLAEAVVRSGDLASAEDEFLRQVHNHLRGRRYAHAVHLTACLPRLYDSGLPMVRHESWFEMMGSDEMYDFRIANYGSGTRLLAILAFDWG